MIRVHYDKNGNTYKPQFIDGYIPENYPTEDEDVKWLIQGGFRGYSQ